MKQKGGMENEVKTKRESNALARKKLIDCGQACADRQPGRCRPSLKRRGVPRGLSVAEGLICGSLLVLVSIFHFFHLSTRQSFSSNLHTHSLSRCFSPTFPVSKPLVSY